MHSTGNRLERNVDPSGNLKRLVYFRTGEFRAGEMELNYIYNEV